MRKIGKLVVLSEFVETEKVAVDRNGEVKYFKIRKVARDNSIDY